MEVRRGASATAALLLLAMAGCGPSDAERQACQTAKGTAAQAYDAFAARLTSEAEEEIRLRERSERLLAMAEEMSRENASAGVSGATELVERTRATRAHHDARGERAEAMTKTAAAASRVADVLRTGRISEVLAAERAVTEAYTTVERASERVQTSARAAGITPRNRYGIEGPRADSTNATAEGLQLEIWRAAIESAQRAGASPHDDDPVLDVLGGISRTRSDASHRAVEATTACIDIEAD